MTPAQPQLPERSRTWPQRFLMSINAFLLLAGLAGTGGLGYLYLSAGRLGRVDVPTASSLPDEPINILLVGSDSRAFVDEPGEAESFGTTAGAPKSDTIMLVRVDAKAATATMLSFPRDLWVKIAELNTENRINVAFNSASEDPEAGARRLIETIRLNFGIPVHHYAQIDFEGFRSLVDAIGGVDFYFASPVRDWDANPADGGRARSMTGLEILSTGCVHLNGEQALGYVRSRHFQQQIDGRWMTEPTADFGRIQRQQDFVRRVAKQALSKGLSDPRKLNSLLKVAADNIHVDEGFTFNDMVAIGKQFKSLSPDAVVQLPLPADSARKRGASVVEISDRAAAEAIFDIFRGVDPNAPKEYVPADVHVRVLNGSRRAGEALATSNALAAVGFAVTDTGNGTTTKVTTIRFGKGQAEKAALLNRHLATDAVLSEDVSLTVDVVLTTGTDFSGILENPRAADAVAPTTTAPAPTTAPSTTAPKAPAKTAATTPAPTTTTTTIPEC